jgi:hypothetical protein
MIIRSLRNEREINKFLEFNENESTTYQNLWDPEKAKLIAMSVYIKNTEMSQINDLKLHLKHLEK